MDGPWGARASSRPRQTSYGWRYDSTFECSKLASCCRAHRCSPAVLVDMEAYHILELIGEGSFGKVYRGRPKSSKQASGVTA